MTLGPGEQEHLALVKPKRVSTHNQYLHDVIRRQASEMRRLRVEIELLRKRVELYDSLLEVVRAWWESVVRSPMWNALDAFLVNADEIEQHERDALKDLYQSAKNSRHAHRKR